MNNWAQNPVDGKDKSIFEYSITSATSLKRFLDNVATKNWFMHTRIRISDELLNFIQNVLK